MSGLKFWPVVLALLFASPPAKGEEPPFVLPDNPRYEKIPNGAGMTFFYGLWDGASRGTAYLPLLIKPEKMIVEGTSSPTEYPYRVLVEGANYVLLLNLVSPDIYTPPRSWTQFEVLTFNFHAYAVGRNYPSLHVHSCGDMDIHRGGEMMNWPRDKIMQVFKASRCLKTIRQENSHYDAFESGWSGDLYVYSKKNPPMNLDIQQ